MRAKTLYEWRSLPLVLTVPEVAQALRVPQNTVRSLLREGAITGVKVGRSWRVEREALSAYIRRENG
jgi:excisionase family DNA binding protein